MTAIIDLPAALSRRVDRIARQRKQTRSEILAAAVAEYVARHDPQAVTASLNRLAAELDTRPDVATSKVALQVLRRSDW